MITAWEAIERKHAPEIILSLETSAPVGKRELLDDLGDISWKTALLTLMELVDAGLVASDGGSWCNVCCLTPKGQEVAEHLRAIREAVE